jgi:hypothetical protein
MGFRVRRRMVGGFFLLFPHLALPFSALHFVGKAEFIQGCIGYSGLR